MKPSLSVFCLVLQFAVAGSALAWPAPQTYRSGLEILSSCQWATAASDDDQDAQEQQQQQESYDDEEPDCE